MAKHRKTFRIKREWKLRLLIGTLAFIAGVTFEMTRTNVPLNYLWLLLAIAATFFASGLVFKDVIGVTRKVVAVQRDVWQTYRDRRHLEKENFDLRREINRLHWMAEPRIENE